MAIQDRDPRPYELMTVFIPELSEEDHQSQIQRTEGYISSAGGTLTETLTSSPWGRRRLAYTIRFNGVDYRDGYYTVFHFDSRPSLLTDLERDLKFDTNVMRYLLVHDDPKAGERHTGEEGADGQVEGETAQPASETAPAAAASPGTDVQAATATTQNGSTDAQPTTEQEPVAATTNEAPAQDVEAAAEVAAETADEAPKGETQPSADETPAEEPSGDDDTSESDKE